MVAIVVAAHGKVAEALVEAAVAIVGPQESLASVASDGASAGCCGGLKAVLGRLESPAGVLVLVDMVGGSPSQAACGAMRSAYVEIVAGVSLPMLLHALDARSRMPLEELARAVADRAAQHAVHLSEVLRRKRAG